MTPGMTGYQQMLFFSLSVSSQANNKQQLPHLASYLLKVLKITQVEKQRDNAFPLSVI